MKFAAFASNGIRLARLELHDSSDVNLLLRQPLAGLRPSEYAAADTSEKRLL
jgi:hypothetical protein